MKFHYYAVVLAIAALSCSSNTRFGVVNAQSEAPSAGPTASIASKGPIETKAPNASYGPIETKAPNASRGPIETKAPHASRGPIETKAPHASRGPKETKAPHASRGPKETKAPHASRGPIETKAPHASRGPKETKAPHASRGPIETKAPAPTDVPSIVPTGSPTASLTVSPTASPSSSPTASTSSSPSSSPTGINRTGESSVVVFGGNPFALGDFSNVNGGKRNSADGDYAVIAGGISNSAAFSKFSTISGGQFNKIQNFNFIQNSEATTRCTISGGEGNFIVSNTARISVITGGQGNSVCQEDIFCSGSTISGGQGIVCNAREAVGTGGNSNIVTTDGDRSVVTGGKDNKSGGTNAVIVGGKDNIADGTLSIALGTQVQATEESSMVINLNPDGKNKSLESKKAGQFIVNAESYIFQIGQNNDSRSSIQITEDNIQNLIDALKNAAAL